MLCELWARLVVLLAGRALAADVAVSTILAIITVICYAGIAIEEARKGNTTIALMFAAYACGNGAWSWELLK